MGWVSEEKFSGEAADGDVSAADSIEKGRVGGRAEGAGDVRGEGSVFEVKDRGVVGLMEKAEMSGVIVGESGGG